MTEQEAKLLALFTRDFLALEHKRVILELSAQEAWAVLAQLQLALRQPNNDGASAHQARKIALEIQELVATTPALLTIAQRGWHTPPHSPGPVAR